MQDRICSAVETRKVPEETRRQHKGFNEWKTKLSPHDHQPIVEAEVATMRFMLRCLWFRPESEKVEEKLQEVETTGDGEDEEINGNFCQPRRHLLTTRWSAFVNKKKLISGDAVLFLRGDNGELSLEIQRAVQLKNSGPYLVPCSRMLNLETLAAVANAVSMKSVFHIYYNPRVTEAMPIL